MTDPTTTELIEQICSVIDEGHALGCGVRVEVIAPDGSVQRFAIPAPLKVTISPSFEVKTPGATPPTLSKREREAAEWYRERRRERAALDVGTTHSPSGMECVVAHLDASGEPLAACLRCRHCRRWIRPESLYDACDGTLEGRG